MRERILSHLSLEPGMVVAEIGVGGGWFVVRVAEAIGPKGVLYGTDIDPGAIEKLRQRLPKLPPGARVELRLCRDERDTALDDLPDGHVDLVLMIDSLCFDSSKPRESNIAYLRGFLRILRAGGRLAHHMDCRCEVSQNGLVELFRDAGFSPNVEIIDVSPEPSLIDASWPCRSEAERQRHAYAVVFRKPDSQSAATPPRATAGPAAAR
jgi:ubiquinone/menaquinone biosynthesis C-methylase UbiE